MSDKDVLDVGFGNGWFIDAVLDRVNSITGVEINLDLVKKAEGKWGNAPAADKVTLRQGHINDLILPTASYDVVIFAHTY